MYFQWLFQTKPTAQDKEVYTWEPDELQETIMIAQQGNDAATHKLCHHFEPLIMSIIHRITIAYGYAWEDLQMVAWEHFLDVIMNYKGSKENFLTLPQYIAIRVLSRTVRSYYKHNRYNITQGTDIDNEEDTELQELLTTDNIDAYILQEGLQDSLKALTEREREIIYKIYYDNKTTDNIGQDYNITGSRVRQLHNLALNKLFQSLEAA